ncbi:MYND-type zinc finger protein samB [Emericellopsis cladophorae]|uniref:MYND-type zinc finger protein samB n=1 Tax=Emericellopsis cladophorae TaxID=2686198 RepID=A0A9P9Y167_9HYPO|nr:MYND-type zinc finger protein samB [Emericellopsis cladophorae]KAI6781248.1 MYND-type zinc finger protein samB [Emericellopsis cladophorae]
MREVNFSIPNVNKASVGITTALYDRRALDCTSTLPLINSLNHLAYLTTSSARIREILTVDGGIERLVCILKEGRSKEVMDLWKWNLAFQCVVNIGVRGTEKVRTRVVEADMVPVIATILDNYIKVVEKCREKADEAKQKHIKEHHQRQQKQAKVIPSTPRATATEDERPPHRQSPLSIDVSASLAGPSTAAATSSGDANAAPTHNVSVASREASSVLAHRRQSLRSSAVRNGSPSGSRQSLRPLASSDAEGTTMSNLEGAEGFLRPVRDIDRLASMAPFGPSDLTSQPTSPTTPLPPPQLRSPAVRPASNTTTPGRNRRRPSIRHQNSTSASEDINGDGVTSDESPDTEMTGTGDIQPPVGIQDITMEGDESMLADASLELATPTVSETHQEAGTFNITHRSPIDGSVVTNNTPTPVPQMGLSPNRPTMVSPPAPALPSSITSRYILDRHFMPSNDLMVAMPREEDVLMSLQLLAYVSKYCGLRSYFQQSHLVPKLNIDKELAAANDEPCPEHASDSEDEEYLLPNDFNLFPLVEKFTVRYHTTDMQYWAGVVMRNLCRKDDTRGGIRQCAYYKCGKWEEYTRQFAKCRRCRRTKYCSKECQKSAWAFHRHWCVQASQ